MVSFRWRMLLVEVLVSASALAAWGSASEAASNRLSGPARAKVEKVVRQFKTTNQTPGVLVGIWSPKGNFVAARGVADLATGTPLDTDMQFKIASQTKTFTANLILQLVGEKKVSLDDHISRWVAGVPNGDEITIRQLLNHTSGLADGFTSPTVQGKVVSGCTVDELLTAEALFPPVAPPGTKMVVQQLRLQPARAGRRARDRSGPQHSRAAAHRQAVGPPPDPPSDIGKRSQQALHPRLRDRRRRPDAGADRRG